MIAHILQRTYRNFTKDKLFASLNVMGLAVGMLVFLLIALYVRFEKSYENFVPNASTIYRVDLHAHVNNELVTASAENYPAVGPALASELPEIVGYARLYNLGYKNNVIVTNDEATEPIAFKHRKFLYADSAFLPMMGYRLMHGDVTTALAHPNTAVITKRYAELYFGNVNPVGKTLHMQDDDNNNEVVTVTGVISEVPQNTHLKFDVLFSYKTLFGRTRPEQPDYGVERYDRSWKRNDMYTFIQVLPGTDVKALESKFQGIVSKYKPDLKEQNSQNILTLRSLPSIHLSSHLSDEPELNGNEGNVSFLGIIGIFVLGIAWINYINLATAKAMERAKEVGVKKVMGATKLQLIKYFLVEASLLNLLSLLIALALVGVALPYFNSLSGLSLPFDYVMQPEFLLIAFCLWAGGTIFSGFYPAMVLSSFSPASALKGKLSNSVRGILFRRALVMFQFVASVSLVAGTIIVYDQLNFMTTQDLGMDINQVLIVERPGIGPYRPGFSSSIDVFRNEVKKNPGVQSMSVSANIPGMQREFSIMVKTYGSTDDKLVPVKINAMDYEFMDVFKMNIVAGRPFMELHTQDPDTSVIITESTARLLGFGKNADAVGQTLDFPSFEWSPVIVGVVNDYHQVSLKEPIKPTFFTCNKYDGEFFAMRIQTSDLNGTIEHVRSAWQKTFPGNPFEYFFLDDYFDQQYKNERQFGAFFSTFAALALFIGCLGLLGLSAYAASQRTKEIGIRKVLGSTEGGIFLLLSKEYMKLISLAIIISVPVVYFAMSRWIESFTYRISISGIVFLIAGGAVLLLSLSTVSFQTWRAARANPVDSIRHD